jgi:hypothetical protein
MGQEECTTGHSPFFPERNSSTSSIAQLKVYKQDIRLLGSVLVKVPLAISLYRRYPEFRPLRRSPPPPFLTFDFFKKCPPQKRSRRFRGHSPEPTAHQDKNAPLAPHCSYQPKRLEGPALPHPPSLPKPARIEPAWSAGLNLWIIFFTGCCHKRPIKKRTSKMIRMIPTIPMPAPRPPY